MAMSDDDILREAARIRSRQRVRLVKPCAWCGSAFEGIAQARYCSDACRMRASRDRLRSEHAVNVAETLAGREQSGGASEQPADDEAFYAALDRLRAFRERSLHRIESSSVDSTEDIRRAREERSRLMEAW